MRKLDSRGLKGVHLQSFSWLLLFLSLRIMESTSASSQEASTSGVPLQDRISVHIPHSMLTLPPTAAAIGLIMGMSRGGSRARLRFLAENAHRMPTTVQGWVSVPESATELLRRLSSQVVNLLEGTACQAPFDDEADHNFHSTFIPRLETTESSLAPCVRDRATLSAWAR